MGTPPPSIRQGVRKVPPDGSVTAGEVLLAVGEQAGHDQYLLHLEGTKRWLCL